MLVSYLPLDNRPGLDTTPPFEMDNLLRVVALASVAAAETELYGAAAPATLLPRYRRGWDYCTANLCGGAERLGALLDVGDLRELGPEGADKIIDAVRAYLSLIHI